MNIIWNAHVNVGGFPLGLGWGVTDDVAARRTSYATVITITLPDRADASVIKEAPNETVVLNRSASLTCGPNGIEAIVTYRVSPLPGAKGHEVQVNVARVAGQKPPATGDVLVQGTGQVGQNISVDVLIPGTCA